MTQILVWIVLLGLAGLVVRAYIATLRLLWQRHRPPLPWQRRPASRRQ